MNTLFNLVIINFFCKDFDKVSFKRAVLTSNFLEISGQFLSNSISNVGLELERKGEK